ncbi:MAG: transposase, partial [Rhodocyclaceae bacterium]|nr:transposase [Rhodocyclaceae bacterium]MCA3146903.1 transposase [Rhodocyclaceae bacterium]
MHAPSPAFPANNRGFWPSSTGHEDLNDHARLREDLVMQAAVGGDESLASAPTLSRLETRATRAQAWALHEVLIEQFIASHERAPTGLVLDVDASDMP